MTLLLVVSCLTGWVTFYYMLCKLHPQRSYEWHCRTLTCIHAVLISFLAGWCSFAQGPWPFTDAGGANTPLQHTTTSICLGYFIFDFSWCLYFKTEGGAMMAHHALSIFGLSVTLILGKYGTELVATICGAEITNPLLQLRWFLKETGHYETVFGEFVDISFMLSFFAMRLGVGSLLLYYYFQQPTDLLGRFGGVCIYIIGWVFCIAIFQYAVRKYTKKWKAWKKRKNNENSSGDILFQSQKIVSRSEELDNIPSQGELKKPNGYLRIGKTTVTENVVNGVVNGHILSSGKDVDKKNL